MTTEEAAIQHGFAYSRDCKVCKKKYRIFLNAEQKEIELYIRKSDGYTKVYRRNKQVAFCSDAHNLNLILNSIMVKNLVA